MVLDTLHGLNITGRAYNKEQELFQIGETFHSGTNCFPPIHPTQPQERKCVIPSCDELGREAACRRTIYISLIYFSPSLAPPIANIY